MSLKREVVWPLEGTRRRVKRRERMLSRIKHVFRVARKEWGSGEQTDELSFRISVLTEVSAYLKGEKS